MDHLPQSFEAVLYDRNLTLKMKIVIDSAVLCSWAIREIPCSCVEKMRCLRKTLGEIN